MAKMALILDGVDVVTVPHSASLDLTNALTLAAHIYFSATPAIVPRIFVKDTGLNSGTYGILATITRTLNLNLAAVTRVSSSILPLNSGTHIAATWDSVSQLPRMYINAALDNTGAAWAGPIPTNVLPLLIGNADTLNRGFPGIFASSRFYNRALSPHEILRCMKGLPVPDGLVLHFDFQYERGSDGTNRIRDLSPYGNHGTNFGARQIPIPDFPPTFKKRRQVE